MINIAIDGYAGSGKSTIAEMLAKKLGYKMLNTGSIYRALACAYRDLGYLEPNNEDVEKFLKNIDVEVKFIFDEQYVFVNGVDYTSQLRLEEISNLSSAISPFKSLREKVLDIQRDFAKKNNCIMEGRDIGTVVLPKAQVKFFTIASLEKRASRRYADMKNVPLEEIYADMKKRDYADEHREFAPLKKADDAIIIDTTDTSAEEASEKCLEIVKLKLEKLQFIC